jgi:hypothetical protein
MQRHKVVYRKTDSQVRFLYPSAGNKESVYYRSRRRAEEAASALENLPNVERAWIEPPTVESTIR